MAKRPHRLALALLCALGLWLLPGCFFRSASAEAPVTRVLLIACENFAEQPSLAPATSGNVNALAQVFLRAGITLHTEVNTVPTIEALGQAVTSAFAGAQPGDLSIFYIATHGQYDPAQPDFPATLTLSDGEWDERVTAPQLQALLDQVPGQKLVILDACNSGAMIGKGIPAAPHNANSLPFQGEDYMVLTSAGGNELSYVWNGRDSEGAMMLGNSYFASTLAEGLGLRGRYGADVDRDGIITLEDIYTYLQRHHACSTVQVYPQRSDRLLMRYDPAAVANTPGLISDVTFSNELLTLDDPAIDFAFTVHDTARIQYQLVYHKNGAWDWANAKLIPDTEEALSAPDQSTGWVTAGRKQRTLTLAGIDATHSGYIILQLIGQGTNGPQIYASKLIALTLTDRSPALHIESLPEEFSPRPSAELALQVSHVFPLRLTVRVLDSKGRMVYRIATNQLSRPLPLTPPGSLFYWDGRATDGQPCPPGRYTVEATTTIGNRRYSAQAELTLTAAEPAP